MMLRSCIRVTLVLLVACGHLAAVPGTPSRAEGSPAATSYCCCPGECHCTADCCNHGPARSADPRPPIMRKGAGAPAWHSHQRCGAAPATLQRAPGHSKVVFTNDGGRLADAPDECRLRATRLDVFPSSTAVLSTSSPRAPPAA